jgi:hypothetical protein
MPVVDVAENIKQTENKIAEYSRSMYRLEGVLQTFKGLLAGGLKQLDLPSDPTQSLDDSRASVEEIESIQEKPE